MDTSINNQPGGPAAQTPNINPNPIPEIMETAISTTPGGSAAETLNINPNPNMENQNNANGSSVTVKESAAEFKCAASSLKNNIKAGKLPATKAGPTAPFMVRLPDVERFLRKTPGIASVFHPGNSAGTDPKQPDATTRSAPAPTPVVAHPEPPKVRQVKVSEAPPVTGAVEIAVQGNPTQVQQPVAQATTPAITSPDADGGPETRATKKRRRRRRGKGGGLGQSLPAAAVRPAFLKALDGTTPAERLRIMACLNELAGLVASA